MVSATEHLFGQGADDVAAPPHGGWRGTAPAKSYVQIGVPLQFHRVVDVIAECPRRVRPYGP